jgi:hypothetical protein
MQLSDLYDLEGLSNQLLLTAGGQQLEAGIDEELSRSLISIWKQLGIPDIES